MSDVLAYRDPDTPVLHGVLGAILHLELLRPDDEERLERACERLWEWLGPELTFANLSCADHTETVRRTHLEYVSSYARGLAVPPAPHSDEQAMHNRFAAHGRTDFFVLCAGADDPGRSSPHSIRFWAEIGIPPDDERMLPAYAALQFTVPETTPIALFRDQVLAVASELRLRWGTAGFTYSQLDLAPGRQAEEAQFAHARRFPGYDLPAYVQLVVPFYRRLRSVSWLTFVGAELAAELATLGRPLVAGAAGAGGQVAVEELGGGTVMLQAGAAPQRGDVNRLTIPSAYCEADALVRPIRSDGTGVRFFHPWDDDSTVRWLRRFEQRVI